LEASFDANRPNRPEMFETFFPRFRHRKSRPKKVIDHRKKIKEREKEKKLYIALVDFDRSNNATQKIHSALKKNKRHLLATKNFILDPSSATSNFVFSSHTGV
jgi:hypothetical protein